MTQGQFEAEFNWPEFRLPPPRLVNEPSLPYHLLIAGEGIISQRCYRYVKCKHPHAGFEHGLLYPFPSMATSTPRTSLLLLLLLLLLYSYLLKSI